MTISSSMNASVAGLAANASRLSTISDNIANSSTFGYKRVEADFHSMVMGGNRGSYTAGGVRATTQRMIDERGALTTTSNATDLAVRGGGMIPVMSDRNLDEGVREVLLATTGSFRPDAQGYLRTDNGLALLGWPANAEGTIPPQPRDTGDGLKPVQVGGAPLRGQPTTEIDIALNLPATSTAPGAEGPVETLSIEYFDNLGMSENLKIDFAPAAENEWTMTVRDSAKGAGDDATVDDIVGKFTLAFSGEREGGGELTGVTAELGAWDADTGQITVDVGPHNDPISVGIGLPNEPDGITQLSDSFAPISVDKNGTQMGNMVSVEVDPSGYVTAGYDNGMNLVLYQIPLVEVADANALEALDGQAYRTTRESGSIFLWSAGDGPTGELVSYAREESTTDTAAELTDLIRTQRAYSSNAKVIQTVDEMLQETTNIKR